MPTHAPEHRPRSGALLRFVTAHAVTVVGEWAATIGSLVLAYTWGGTTAVGLTSIAVLTPPLLFAPVAAALAGRYRPDLVRLGGFVVQVIAYGAAAIAAALDLPSPVVTVGVVLGLGAINTLRPSGAVLLPIVARSTSELVTANLRISYCDSCSALVGPLIASVLIGVGGPAAVFAACAAAAGLAALATVGSARTLVPAVRAAAPTTQSRRVIRAVVSELRTRRWALGVLGVASARNVVVGAFDVLLVILAITALDLGDGGPGLLAALVGGGAMLSTFVATLVVRRAQLRRSLTVSLAVAAVLCLGLGVFTEPVYVYAALPVLGVCLSLMDNLSRMLMQRSTGPQHLGPLFACLGLIGGAGQFAGSIVAQVLVAVAGLEAALVGVGAVLVLIALTTRRSLAEADANADVPVVEMSLLAGIPMFAALPPATLESVARAAEPVSIRPGEEIIRQGDTGDTFYAVVDGEFEIEMNGVFLRSAPRGDFFGEVALLSDVTRTATVRARVPSELLAIHRDPFLVAITGHETSHQAALTYVEDMNLAEKMRWTSEQAMRRPEST